ncbi:hypothetical protein HX038_01270 [Myroides odoratimimus]|uniref:DUF4369 domain-containing protein n=1 Tax=Myroides odoratimimus CCUG 10230 TaxID=883150 RepID=A0ABN0E7Q7_9FLAO|nr:MULTISPECIES: hypothetical protein [Myroides]AJA68006.1 hypothetical protein MYRA21_0821 [Myroides sp. A21]EHO07087.1 hypothetical protein HMPREF9712_02876 [Myroides odoratimimus CCUG 10230]MDM1064090.1 hypothetical protein [Myroides odoratimimus]MDM1083475.1 hypothetical protein [Myroides odoratimimus]MDM1409382.1 hypothetical protein [Myroides odoratimimus]
MKNIKYIAIIVTLLLGEFVLAQEGLKTLNGKILFRDGDRDEVLVLNASKGTSVFSDDKGYFSLQGEANDTLRFVSLSYLLHVYMITEVDLNRDLVLFSLERNTIGEVLDEIVVTKKNKSPYPKYTYKSKGPSPMERQLAYATSGLIAPLINMLNGRTKMLKKALVYERAGFRADKFLDYVSDELLVDKYKIPYDYVESFALYAVNDEKVKEALEVTPVDMTYLETVIAPVAVDFLEVIKDRPFKELEQQVPGQSD